MVSAELNKFHNLRDFSISPNEDEAFFTVQSPNGELSMIVCVKDQKWDDPTILPFCDRYAYLEPFYRTTARDFTSLQIDQKVNRIH